MNRKSQSSCAAVAAAVLLCGAAPPSSAASQAAKYGGICDASAAVALDANRFMVADDEHNILQIYDKNSPGKKPQSVNLRSIFPGEIKDAKGSEIDIEGAAVLGNKIFWIGSHGTNKDAEPRPERQRLFAISVKPGAGEEFVVERAGKIYTTLLTDLEKDERFKKYGIGAAKKIQPKGIGGLSIEGLAATPNGSLLIGFRNPLIGGKMQNGRIVGGKALLVTLTNPLDVIQGKAAQFDSPIELDLGGYGIRSIESRTKDEYLIVAGPYHENDATPREESRLYRWAGKTVAPIDVKLDDLNVEAAFFYPNDSKQVELLSDDGNKKCTGFRSRLVRVEPR